MDLGPFRQLQYIHLSEIHDFFKLETHCRGSLFIFDDVVYLIQILIHTRLEEARKEEAFLRQIYIRII